MTVRVTSPQNRPNNSGHITIGSRHLPIDRAARRGSVSDEERLGVYGERHVGFATGVLSPHDLQGSPDALCLDRYPIADDASCYFDRNPYHLTVSFCFRLRCVLLVMMPL